MKLLFDQNISFRIIKKLEAVLPGCSHVSDCGLMNCNDSEIWEYAKSNGFSIVSFDSDFYDISVIEGHPPKIIWLRRGNMTTIQIANLIIDNKGIIEKFLDSLDYTETSCLEIQ